MAYRGRRTFFPSSSLHHLTCKNSTQCTDTWTITCIEHHSAHEKEERKKTYTTHEHHSPHTTASMAYMYTCTCTCIYMYSSQHPPVYGVVGVLQEVGALLLSQTVLSPPRRGRRWFCARARGHGSQRLDDTPPARAREAWSQMRVKGSDSDSSANLGTRD